MSQWIACRKRQPPARGKYLALRRDNPNQSTKFYDPVTGWTTKVPILYWAPLLDYPPGYLAGTDEENEFCNKMMLGDWEIKDENAE